MFFDQPAIARRKKSRRTIAMEPAAGPSHVNADDSANPEPQIQGMLSSQLDLFTLTLVILFSFFYWSERL